MTNFRVTNSRVSNYFIQKWPEAIMSFRLESISSDLFRKFFFFFLFFVAEGKGVSLFIT